MTEEDAGQAANIFLSASPMVGVMTGGDPHKVALLYARFVNLFPYLKDPTKTLDALFRLYVAEKRLERRLRKKRGEQKDLVPTRRLAEAYLSAQDNREPIEAKVGDAAGAKTATEIKNAMKRARKGVAKLCKEEEFKAKLPELTAAAQEHDRHMTEELINRWLVTLRSRT